MYMYVHVYACIHVYVQCTCTCTRSGWMYIVYACLLALPYLAYTTVDLNPANWAASVAQLAEHWTSNPVAMGSNPVRGSSVFFHCLPSDFASLDFPCFNAYTCTRLIMK